MARKRDAQQLRLEVAPLEQQVREQHSSPSSAVFAGSATHKPSRRAQAATPDSKPPLALRRAAAELLATPGALLTRSHLRGLGLERRAVDAVFRHLPVVALPGYSRPMIRAEDYASLVERHTFRDDRVRPTGSTLKGLARSSAE
jgi:hypothetical protein